ncbi:class I SAM-dependent methyltransferase [Cyclobacterium salsum]|uniref:class I SAM-dependent methyltransferase n=1 Tax=Cyclobacterium salsum TaxID=2666329 RepID=UPI001391A6DF|nr:class I SAM-dependent methyltransferase [Cyclobacterium salsum]
MEGYSCLICHNDIAGPTYRVKEMMFGSGEPFAYTQCPQCGTIQQLNPPQNMSAFYPKAYYSLGGLSLSNVQVRWMKRLRFFLFRKFGLTLFQPVYGKWLRILDIEKDQAIADIGCGNGQLLYELYSSGYRNLSGFDPFMESTRSIAPGLRLYKMELDQIQGTFHAVMLHHAFEHLPQPDASFAQLAKILRAGGKLLIRVPVSDGEAWNEYRENWVQLDAPRHYFIPSVAGMKMLAERHGLELYHTEFDSTSFQFWASQKYQKGHSLHQSGQDFSPSAEVLKEFEKRAASLNRIQKGDQAAFYFRKPR